MASRSHVEGLALARRDTTSSITRGKEESVLSQYTTAISISISISISTSTST